jgi:hypothetical protein
MARINRQWRQDWKYLLLSSFAGKSAVPDSNLYSQQVDASRAN